MIWLNEPQMTPQLIPAWNNMRTGTFPEKENSVHKQWWIHHHFLTSKMESRDGKQTGIMRKSLKTLFSIYVPSVWRSCPSTGFTAVRVNYMELWQLLQCSWKQTCGKCNKKVSIVPLGDLAFYSYPGTFWFNTHYSQGLWIQTVCIHTSSYGRINFCSGLFFLFKVLLIFGWKSSSRSVLKGTAMHSFSVFFVVNPKKLFHQHLIYWWF